MNSLKPLLSMALMATQDINRSVFLRPINALNQYMSVRFKPVHPRIRGHPRKPLPGKPVPVPHKYAWRPIYPLDGNYTVYPLKIEKLGGRDPQTGRVVVKTRGGGNKKYFRWIDYKNEVNPDGIPFREKVFQIRYDPLRTTKLALVAGGDKIRWITATETMQVGDIVTTYSDIPRNPIRPKEGDNHPVGALPIGTKVNNVEVRPGEGGTLVRGAGNFAEIVRRVGKKNYLKLRLPEREICIDERCMVTIGRMSNPYHHTINRMCPQRSRWLGYRPRSGAWHRKDGYCGRKNRPPKPLQDFMIDSALAPKREPEVYEIQPFS
ncbi:39S ribosomal protein L2, mitochondrial-like [Oppia nitens]|uniref:39S ribosomal protein L2, mitochondrial-like n=1 Tax=Oppia nitens TaxID=1686743 RepID=UPI0023DB7EC4|nr:39S ribosomal protein L2, mitochondrial-like [Oppia nitens]